MEHPSTEIAIEIAQLGLVGLASPLLVGLIRRMKARFQGRRGPSVLQPYRDLRKLFSKEVVVSENSSWIFRFTPYLLATTMLVSALIVPVLAATGAFSFLGNIIVLMYLFLLGTFFLALAGLDAGSAFGGMGSSREVAIAALAAPYLATAPALLICALLVTVSFYVMAPVAESNPLPTADALPLAFAGVLVGFFIMVNRRRAVTQILGFLMLENGIFQLALLATYGVPFLVEMGVFLDVLVAVLIMEVFIYHIKDNFDSIDVGELGKLKE